MKYYLLGIFPSLFEGVNRDRQDDLSSLLKVAGNGVKIVMWLCGFAAVVVIIIAGIMYITSAGNPEGINRAKKTITNAIIGLLLSIFAFAIVSYIVDKF